MKLLAERISPRLLIENSRRMPRTRASRGNELDSTEADRRVDAPEAGFGGETRRKAKTSVKIPRFSKRRESKAGMCSVDAARHPPFSADARASQGRARSSPPEPAGELDASLTNRYERPYASKDARRSQKTILEISAVVKRSFRSELERGRG